MKRVLITGHTSGLGKAIWEAMEGKAILTGWSLETGVDVCDEAQIKEAVVNAAIENDFSPFDILINCAGVNHIDWHENVSVEIWDWLMGVNARAPWLITKELLQSKMIQEGGAILNIISNASHMPMTNSAAYNASKGAAHILTLQMARELFPRHGLTVFGISPNKLKGTGMSAYIDERVCGLRGWTPEEAAEYQIKSLPAKEETDPSVLAEFIAFILSSKERHKYLAGCVLPYGA